MFITSVFFLLILTALFYQFQASTYSTKWDNINVDEVIHSERLLKNYRACLLDTGSCSPEGADLKKNLADALQHDCSKCSKKQKENMDKVSSYLMENKPDWWKELEERYDPKKMFAAKHLKDKVAETS